MACERIKAAITATLAGERPVKAILDAYNPTGSTRYVNFTTSKETRWQTDPRKCHVNWVICDSDWEAEFCRVAESHPRVRAYVKNQNLGLEVPYLMAGQRAQVPPRFHRPDRRRREPEPLQPDRRDQGLSRRGRQGKGEHACAPTGCRASTT